MKNKKIKLYKTDKKLGFDYYGTFITDCFESDCGRFVMDPIKDYGLTDSQVKQMIKTNNLQDRDWETICDKCTIVIKS